MEKVRIGFVPVHRAFFSEDWAVQMRERTLKALEKIETIEVIVPDESVTKRGLVTTEEDALNAVAFFQEQDVEGLLFGTVTFGDELAALTVAEQMQDLPMLLFGTKEGPFTADGNRLSDSFCGTLSLASGLYRRRIPFLFSGIHFPEEKELAENIRSFARTCYAIGDFVGARIGMVGPRPEPFETCAFNEITMIQQFGQRVVPTTLVETFSAARAIPDDDPEALEIVNEIKEKTAGCIEVSEEALLKSAKLELVLQKFAEDNNLAGMGVQCWTAMQTEYGISSCTAMGRLTEKGIMTSCEVDIHGALTMLLQYGAALHETVPHFIDWTIQHQEKENVFLAWHCGNAPMCLAAKGALVCLRSHSILSNTLGTEPCQGTAEFPLAPGTVTLNRLVEHDGIFKLLITKGEILPPTQELRGSWSWVEVPDLKKLYRTLVEEGFVHHASMIHGDWTVPLENLCKFLDIEAVVV
ncbi:MAG: L-fucose/L-arabinose isomerase family protein [Anaerolineae bacterium]